MARIFKTPFGAQGDTEQVPEAPQGDGSVSLTQGFGYDYEREYEDPAAKDIRREVMNGLFHDITEAIGDIQLSGIAKWSADAAPYPAGAVVWHDSVAWMSTAGDNSSEPGTGSWKAVDLSTSISLSEPIDQVPSANNVQEALAALGAFAADGYQNIAVFDAAGVTEWDVPAVLQAGLRKAYVTVVGGGGSGQRLTTTGGAGGGAGGTAIAMVDLSDESSVPITVGSGGSLVTSGPGNSGESTSFGSFLSATGGEGGSASGVSTPGGSGIGGDINIDGGRGTHSITTGQGVQIGGTGGSSYIAPGGAGGVLGRAGQYGSGGGGAQEGSNSGRGGDGIVIVRW